MHFKLPILNSLLTRALRLPRLIENRSNLNNVYQINQRKLIFSIPRIFTATEMFVSLIFSSKTTKADESVCREHVHKRPCKPDKTHRI